VPGLNRDEGDRDRRIVDQLRLYLYVDAVAPHFARRKLLEDLLDQPSIGIADRDLKNDLVLFGIELPALCVAFG
jgi:hypothetical protein